ncbi:NADP-dependent phosphogluconate dehydrogenase [Aquabacterium sp. OR-4]|uniref:NADP-dependent phosphogluconate dehydrogenase n=1 Tax=Aquabacterium sp. OR-4 TaxID=2978127 RepID=UPI0021B46D31|nr:NADP-dependent phosphogluconate dehydrogenase [Aquabacterium sp. OR-4]MDT7838421.1 NADP-dependent phosphogluconate dehydrogenase [Aquabacterium sp. OR-4]
MTQAANIGHIAIVGLGVMGRNLALNLADHGHTVIAYDLQPAAALQAQEAAVARGAAASGQVLAVATPAELVAALAPPRKILLMVNAGAPVDAVLERLLPLLAAGDIVIDGGNSRFTDTERRSAALAARGLHFVGSGISGGEEGARHGPALMPGGSAEAWAAIRPLFEAIAAQAHGQPCVAHIGPGGAGHYVKMVHNGIEYADMQLICEAYALLAAAGLDNDPMAAVFARWNAGPLQSYLIEITAKILAQRDADTGRHVLDLILDKAGQKGTGQWTLVDAAERAVVVSAMGAAVDARVLSSLKAARVAASTQLAGPDGRIDPATLPGGAEAWVALVHDALMAAKIVAYAQGFELMATAGRERGWGLDLAAIARLWRGGCIIRAQFLDRIAEAQAAPSTAGAPVANLMLAPWFRDTLARVQGPWREVLATAVRTGVPVPAMSAALAYHDSWRSPRLSANLLQAQRDFFGAHTYERIDRPAGQHFHTEWPQA